MIKLIDPIDSPLSKLVLEHGKLAEPGEVDSTFLSDELVPAYELIPAPTNYEIIIDPKIWRLITTPPKPAKSNGRRLSRNARRARQENHKEGMRWYRWFTKHRSVIW